MMAVLEAPERRQITLSTAALDAMKRAVTRDTTSPEDDERTLAYTRVIDFLEEVEIIIRMAPGYGPVDVMLNRTA